ncbi:MAG: hypothetical protein HC772_16220 [Leptolyngbyaceae cyanobacterium CRU_2_3]|nr:hypothetical protein [Leptolyngbyaceae cyanobacterium CRU_2_3]
MLHHRDQWTIAGKFDNAAVLPRLQIQQRGATQTQANQPGFEQNQQHSIFTGITLTLASDRCSIQKAIGIEIVVQLELIIRINTRIPSVIPYRCTNSQNPWGDRYD